MISFHKYFLSPLSLPSSGPFLLLYWSPFGFHEIHPLPLCFSLFLSSFHIWGKKNIWPLTFWVWFISLNTVFSSYPFSWKWRNFLLLYGWIKLHSVCIPHFLYLFTNWWTPRLVPYFGYCELCCYKHGYACITIVCWF